MTGLLLFGRSRHWGIVTLVAFASAVLVVACGPLSYSLNPQNGYLVTVASQIPVIVSIAIQASIASPLVCQERSAVRTLARYRRFHVVLLTTIASALFASVGPQLEDGFGTVSTEHNHLGAVALVRNTMAFTGIGLVGARVLAAKVAWVFPVAWAMIPFVMLPDPKADHLGLLTLAGQDDDAFLPFAVAATCWVVGIALSSGGRPFEGKSK